MEIQPLWTFLRDGIVAHSDVKAVFGEPVSADGRTIIPVAKITYGFGGGGGMNRMSPRNPEGNQGGQEGGGGGGGVRAVPVGVIEVSGQGTQFIPISDRRKLAAAALGGMMFGMILGWRRSRR
jgi:uncharacterized spore protein YtfJ